MKMLKSNRLPNCATTGFVLVFCACLLMLTLFGRIVIISSNTDLNQIPHSSGLFRQPSIAPSQSRLETQKLTDFEKNFGTVNELDGCYHVYLDVGSNVGIQVRKLFEQKLYPNANILAVFESYFGPADDKGNRQETVCAVGFEPNARHTPALQDVEQAHKACGWRSHFYTETAAAHDYGTIEFFSDNDMGHREWGGSIVAKSGKATGTAKKMRLADYVLEWVVNRDIPESASTRKPSVLMKMDIEGSELEVLTDMIASGALQHVNYTFAEFHPNSFKPTEKRNVRLVEVSRITNWLNDVTQELGLKSQIHVDTFDDESYFDSSFPLPKC